MVFPLGVTEVEPGAFYNCANLKTAVLNEGLEVLCRNGNGDYGVFQSCGL